MCHSLILTNLHQFLLTVSRLYRHLFISKTIKNIGKSKIFWTPSLLAVASFTLSNGRVTQTLRILGNPAPISRLARLSKNTTKTIPAGLDPKHVLKFTLLAFYNSLFFALFLIFLLVSIFSILRYTKITKTKLGGPRFERGGYCHGIRETLCKHK
jgi:hypothetical protein